MSRQYNPAVTAYKRMDLNNFPDNVIEETNKPSGLLQRTQNNNKEGIDYSNPVVRVAKQMQIVRKYRDEINGNK